MSVKGLLATLLGLDSNGIPYALGVNEDGYLEVSFVDQAGSGSKRNPKGLLISPVGFSPTDVIKNFQVAADGSLIITFVGGSANQVIKSDGTDAEWDDLSDVIEAAILTADGDILIRDGGVAKRLAKPAVGQILGESSQIPAWIAKPTGAYTEGARVSNSANISIANVTWVSLTFDTERYDTDGIHSTVSNTDRLTCKTAGKYVITGNVTWSNVAVDAPRSHRIYLNGTTAIAYFSNPKQPNAGDELSYIITTQYDLAVNDYITFDIYQQSGSTINALARSEYSPLFMMQRIG